jgi:hypothetical protein
MSNKIEVEEAQAVMSLRGSNEEAFKKLIDYFNRRYDIARDKCVSTAVERVQVEQGIARAYDEIKDIEAEAERVLGRD